MAGKQTHKNGKHSSREIRVERTLAAFPDAEKERIEHIIGRVLTDGEVDMLLHRVNNTLTFQTYQGGLVSTRDAKATLLAMVELDDTELVNAFNCCDARTSAALHLWLWNHGERDHLMNPNTSPKPECIRQAARNACSLLPQTSGGRPEELWRPMFAKFVRETWGAVGRTDDRAWRNSDGDYSPIVEFALALYDAISESNSSTSIGASGVHRILEQFPN
jgi:hypothetical protein